MNVFTDSHKHSMLDERKEHEHRLEEMDEHREHERHLDAMKEAIRVAYQDGQITSDEMELLDRQRASLGVTVEEFRYCYEKIVK